jgi:hypothetical protein
MTCEVCGAAMVSRKCKLRCERGWLHPRLKRPVAPGWCYTWDTALSHDGGRRLEG